jgi:hypothetical protein
MAMQDHQMGVVDLQQTVVLHQQQKVLRETKLLERRRNLP